MCCFDILIFFFDNQPKQLLINKLKNERTLTSEALGKEIKRQIKKPN